MFAPGRSRRGIRAFGMALPVWLDDQDDPSALAYEEDVRADALPAGAVQAPRPARGADLRAWRYATQQKHPVLWGPVPAAEAARIAGAPAGCESVLIAPAIPSDLLRDVENLIPASVKPWPTDTAQQLAARLGESDFLDDIHFKKGGHGRGGKYVRINETKYPQPSLEGIDFFVNDRIGRDCPVNKKPSINLWRRCQIRRWHRSRCEEWSHAHPSRLHRAAVFG